MMQREPAHKSRRNVLSGGNQRLMGWTLSAGDGPEGTETPGVRRKQEERGQEVEESCLLWEEAAAERGS